MSAHTKWKIGISLVSVLLILYFAGTRELEIGLFSPKLPTFLPKNAIWIDAPMLPLTFAHGWWLGCEKLSDNFDRCILVGHNDRFSGGDATNRIESDSTYLSCKTSGPLPNEALLLKSPRSSMNMWVGHYDSSKQFVMEPAAFLQNGDVLVPATELSQCPKFEKLK